MLGKLQQYVPGDNEILLSSCTLQALFSQTTQLIKTSQFRPGWILEFLSLCSLQNEAKHQCLHSKRTCHFKSNISGSLCTLHVPAVQLFDAFAVHLLSEQWCRHILMWESWIFLILRYLLLIEVHAWSTLPNNIRWGGWVHLCFYIFFMAAVTAIACCCLCCISHQTSTKEWGEKNQCESNHNSKNK